MYTAVTSGTTIFRGKITRIRCNILLNFVAHRSICSYVTVAVCEVTAEPVVMLFIVDLY